MKSDAPKESLESCHLYASYSMHSGCYLVYFAVINAMAPALVCVNVIVVSKGRKMNLVSYQGLGAYRIPKQS